MSSDESVLLNSSITASDIPFGGRRGFDCNGGATGYSPRSGSCSIMKSIVSWLVSAIVVLLWWWKMEENVLWYSPRDCRFCRHFPKGECDLPMAFYSSIIQLFNSKFQKSTPKSQKLPNSTQSTLVNRLADYLLVEKKEQDEEQSERRCPVLLLSLGCSSERTDSCHTCGDL
jgi:hypothetical protein